MDFKPSWEHDIWLEFLEGFDQSSGLVIAIDSNYISCSLGLSVVD